MWAYPDTWLEGDHDIDLGPRTLAAVHTPGHTPGHFVFADHAAGLLFAGDHVLPTITPSIGFTVPADPLPLADFLGSLAKVRALPDLEILPAHGPVAPSSHERVDELVVHHERRLDQSLAALASGPRTAREVAGELHWTRHERTYDGLDIFSQGMAAMETKAHLEPVLVRQPVGRSGRTFAASVDARGRGQSTRSCPPAHRHVRDPVVQVLRAGDLEPERRVPVGQRRLSLQYDVAAGAHRQRGLHQHIAQAAATSGGARTTRPIRQTSSLSSTRA